MELLPGEGSKNRMQCFDKCHTSFHRDNPTLIMDEERCHPKKKKCPGYSFASTVFVYCHLFIKPLLDLPDLPNDEVRDMLRDIFSRCSSPNPKKREITWKFVKRFEAIFALKSYAHCNTVHHSALLHQVLHSTINTTGATASFRPIRKHDDHTVLVQEADQASLRNLSLFVSIVGVLLLFLVRTAGRVRSTVIKNAEEQEKQDSNSAQDEKRQLLNSRKMSPSRPLESEQHEKDSD